MGIELHDPLSVRSLAQRGPTRAGALPPGPSAGAASPCASQPRTRPEQLRGALEEAGHYDPTLALERASLPRMLRRYVHPAPCTRETLFSHMLAAEPCVLTGFPVPSRGPIGHLPVPEAGSALMDWLGKRRSPEKHRIFTGPTGVRREIAFRDIAARWRAGRTRFGVTDLHIRHSLTEEVIDPGELTSFDLLNRFSLAAQEQEMFSFVISTRGYVTDSHSDAPDSSNFAFIGRKLWLAWDTYEGARRGLQDVDRVPVSGRARFDMETWLSLPSARWFIVTPGDTLFLPANMTHKVITLESYIGVGGFFLALPNCLRLLTHWIVHGPLWSKRDATGRNDQLLDEISHAVRDTILRLLTASADEQRQMGYDFLEASAKHFIRKCPAAQLRALLADPRFSRVAEVIPGPWPASRATAH